MCGMKRKFNQPPKAKPVSLQKRLMALEPLYKELGELAEQFKMELRATSAHEEIDENEFDEVHYTNYSLGRGWLNRIIYGPGAVEKPVQLFINRLHEGVHAIQQRNCRALWLDPRNPRAYAVLSPESFLHARELMEREAYAKEALFSALLAFMRPELEEELSRYTACDKAMFGRIAESYFNDDGSLPAILSEAADNALDNLIEFPGGVVMTFRDAYRENFLKEYDKAMQGRAIVGHLQSLTFVSATDADLAPIGRNVGPSGIGADEALFPAAAFPNWSPTVRERIDELHRKYGIPAAGLVDVKQALFGGMRPAPR